MSALYARVQGRIFALIEARGIATLLDLFDATAEAQALAELSAEEREAYRAEAARRSAEDDAQVDAADGACVGGAK